jgi:hypothetical protein
MSEAQREQSCKVLKKATFSPFQPWRAKMRLVPGKAAAVYYSLSTGWPGLVPNRAHRGITF